MIPLMNTAPVSDMNRRPGEVLAMLKEGPIALMARSDPAAIMVSPVEWNKIAKDLEELENLRDIVAAYRAEIDIWNGEEEVTDIDLDQLQLEIDDAKVPA
jgi:PHD/YefM family antitoxin component YafN of YafNO toxin-antitoxin module